MERLEVRPGDGRVIVTGIASRSCVQCAVTGFSIRDYYVYVPMDCTAAKDEIETLQSFSLYRGAGYRYNVTLTRSDMITLQPGTAAEQIATASDAPAGVKIPGIPNGASPR